MKIAIIGGKLQGTEAAFLAREAGFESILIDKNPEVQASGLVDKFVCGDIVARDPNVISALKEVDFVLPANENDEVLKAVVEICEAERLRLAFDADAYAISSSKILSDTLFHENDIPSPLYYPLGKAPYIIKPSRESGSSGVTYAETAEQAEHFLKSVEDRNNWVVQEYLEGPSYSIEVIGNGEKYRTYSVTQIHMDSVYDCCCVTAPCEIPESQKIKFAEIGEKIAKLVNLHGIMDVEVILSDGCLKVLEIDARIPSQTPIAVLYSSGMNLLSELAEMTVFNKFLTPKKNLNRYSAYEHYKLQGGQVVQEGEHMMSDAGPLHVEEGLFGSDMTISDYKSGAASFRGIFINSAETFEDLESKRIALQAQLKLLP